MLSRYSMYDSNSSALTTTQAVYHSTLEVLYSIASCRLAWSIQSSAPTSARPLGWVISTCSQGTLATGHALQTETDRSLQGHLRLLWTLSGQPHQPLRLNPLVWAAKWSSARRRSSRLAACLPFRLNARHNSVDGDSAYGFRYSRINVPCPARGVPTTTTTTLPFVSKYLSDSSLSPVLVPDLSEEGQAST